MRNVDVEITAEPAEMREAICHLSDRERETLHHIHAELDLRGGPDDVAVLQLPR